MSKILIRSITVLVWSFLIAIIVYQKNQLRSEQQRSELMRMRNQRTIADLAGRIAYRDVKDRHRVVLTSGFGGNFGGCMECMPGNPTADFEKAYNDRRMDLERTWIKERSDNKLEYGMTEAQVVSVKGKGWKTSGESMDNEFCFDYADTRLFFFGSRLVDMTFKSPCLPVANDP